MADDIVPALKQIQQSADALRELVAAAQSMAPAQAHGSDPSGAVQMALGPDGLPESIRITGDWRQRLDPTAFGSAVVEAFTAAAQARLAAWTKRLADSGWQAHIDQLRRVGTPFPARPLTQATPALPATPPARRRALHQLAEDGLAAFDAVERYAKPPALTAQGTGRAADGKLTVILSPSALVSCTADAPWVSQQSAAKLSRALEQALAAARADLARAAAAPNPTDHLNQLLGEALAILGDPERLAEP